MQVASSVSRHLSTIFQTWQRRAYRHDSTRNTAYLYNSYSKKLTSFLKGKPSREDNSLPIIDHLDLVSSVYIKHHLNHRPKWKLWSTAPSRTSQCTPNLSEPKFNMLQISVQYFHIEKLNRMTACTRTHINNVVL